MALPLAAAAALVLTGCISTHDRTAGRVVDDRIVDGRVKSALNDSTIYKFEDVQVKTYNGVVQLSGWATTEEQKNKAGEIANGVEGVHQVFNNIAVKFTPTGRESIYPLRQTTNQTRKVDAPLKASDEVK